MAVSWLSGLGSHTTKTPLQLGVHTACSRHHCMSCSCIVTIAVKVVGLSHAPQQREDGKHDSTKEGAGIASQLQLCVQV